MKPSPIPIAAALGVSRATVCRVLAEQPPDQQFRHERREPECCRFLELARHSKIINAQRSIWRPILECRIDSGDGRIDTINQGRTMVMRVKVSPGTIAGDVDEGYGKLADVSAAI